MRRAPVRGWWALPVAAGLTLIVPATAQPPAPAGARPAAEAADRLAEITVELAWLADPLTFPCELAARVRAGRMDIRGFVPNETARIRAVRTARLGCELPVMDSLTLQPAASRQLTVPVEQLRTGVEVILRKRFPERISGLKILCGAHGQVILSGRVGSAEEKLAMSQALRRLPGCTSVVNELTAPGELPVQTAAGPSKAPAPQGTPFSAASPAAEGTAANPNRTPGPAAGPKGTSFAAAPTVAPRTETVSPVRTPPQIPEGPAPTAVNVAAPPRPVASLAQPTWVSAPVPPLSPESPPASPYAASQSQPPSAAWRTAAPGAASPSPYAAWTSPVPPKTQIPARPASTPFAAPSASAAPSRPQAFATGATAASPLPVLDRVGERPTDEPRLTPTPVASAPAPSRPATVQVVQTAYRPEGVSQPFAASPSQGAVTPAPAKSAAPITPPPVPTATASRPQPRPGEPYVTTGMLILPDSQRPSAEAASPWARRQEYLKQLVQATCGSRATDLAVEIQSPTQATVRFRAPTKRDADRLWAEITRMPELAPYELRAEIKAADTGR
jgi:hypothetical protein